MKSSCWLVWLMTLLVISTTCAVVYRPHVSLSMKNTTLKWKSKAKLEGVNVCAKETIWEGTPVTYDVAWTGGAVCYPTTVQLDCCDGWKSVPGERGCSQALSVTSAEATSERVKAGWWLRLLGAAGLKSYLDAVADPLTVFAPISPAASALSAHNMLLLEQGARNAYNLMNAPQLLLSHVIQGGHRTDQLHNNDLLTSLSSNLPVRINIFPNGLVTASCVPILSRDVLTDGPIIHTLARPLPQTYRYPITDTLLRHNHARTFASYIAQSHLENLLRSTGPFTVLVPTDTAFDALGHDHAHALRYDELGMKALVQNHITDGVQCSAMLGNAVLLSHQKETIRTQCKLAAIYVKGAKVVEADTIATNGVIHVIDRVLVPRRALLLVDVLKSLGLTTLAGLVDKAGLAATFSAPDPFTLFAPTNSALEGVLSRLNATEAGVFLMNHMVEGRILTESFKDREQIASKGSRLPYTVRTLRQKLLVDSAVITSSDVEGLNGVVHVIDRVLPPPRRRTIVQWLKEDGRYTEFLYALRTMQPALYARLDSNHEKFTAFVVGDSYLTNRFNLYYNQRVLLNHILEETLVSEVVPANGRLMSTTISSGELLLVRRGIAFLAGSTHVLQRDVLCSNGVIHVVRDVILDPRHY